VKNELQKCDKTRRDGRVAHENVALRTLFDRVIHGRSGNNGAQGAEILREYKSREIETR